MSSSQQSSSSSSLTAQAPTVAPVTITIAGEFKASTTATTSATSSSNGKGQGVKYNAIAAMNATDPLQHYSYEPQSSLGDHDVEIKVAACGVCHSDIHQVKKFARSYPFIAGHEVIGEVIAIGSAVTLLTIGQRVGIGCQTNSCGTCRECMRGETQLCATQGRIFPHGGFSSHVRVHERWAFVIPDALPTVHAAPLLCAGLTSWSPFIHNKVKAGDRVGVIGVGGLGHLAIKFGAALGCEVWGISTSSSKLDEVKSYGGRGIIVSTNNDDMTKAANSFDFLLSTIEHDGINWDSYLNLLRPDGTLCLVGLSPSVKFNPLLLIVRRLKIVGGMLASHQETIDMLQFCARHNITAATEEMPMTAANVNKAFERVHASLPRYRIVLVNHNNGLLTDDSTTSSSSAATTTTIA